MDKILKRKDKIHELEANIAESPAVALLGPRQCGKSTLAKQMDAQHRFDLENPRDLARLENPQLALESLSGLIVIDEVQRRPDLFPLLRYLIDQKRDQKFLLLGSASRDLVRDASESLAGRIAYVRMGGFTYDEICDAGISQEELWIRGGYPRSVLAGSQAESVRWRENYIATFLERDIPNLGITIPAETLRRFWIMISHYHGQVLNYSEIARSFGISDQTVRRYLEILVGTFMIDLLPPWHTNLGKRLIKSPKLYVRDSGIFHTLQSIDAEAELLSHPKLGASWEGFAIAQVIHTRNLSPGTYYFYASHGGAELDLFWQKGGRSFGLEVKYQDAPRHTKSTRTVTADLQLDKLWIVYPGASSYDLDDKTTVVPLTTFLTTRGGSPSAC